MKGIEMRFHSLIDNQYGNWKVLELDSNSNDIKWICKCIECGNIKSFRPRTLKRGINKTCKCHLFHGDTGTRFHKLWYGIIERCTHPGCNQYRDYGARGITVCDKWLKYLNFKEDMYKSYLKHADIHGEDNTTIDRIDNDLGYEYNNCRWATYSVQSYNKRFANARRFRATYIEPGPSYGYVEESDNQSAFARKYGLRSSNLNACLQNIQNFHKGWTFKYLD